MHTIIYREMIKYMAKSSTCFASISFLLGGGSTQSRHLDISMNTTLPQDNDLLLKYPL